MSKKDTELKRDNPLKPRQKLKLTVPLPLTQNHMYVNRIVKKRIIRVLNGDAQKYMAQVMKYVSSEATNQGWYTEENDTWYIVDMWFYMPDRKTRDNHNCFKLLFDSLEGFAFKNDYYILPRVQEVELDRENPRVEIEIRKKVYKNLKK